jgi:hypothetical protein
MGPTPSSPALETVGKHWNKAVGMVAQSFNGKGVPETIDSDVLDICALADPRQHVAEVVSIQRLKGTGDEEGKDSRRSSRLTR